MYSAGWLFRLNPDYVISLGPPGPNLNNYYFYQDFSTTLDGPKELPTTMNFGSTDFQPVLLLYGEDATTSGWVNRGTLGGTLSAVNIRPQDIQQDTPFKDLTTKGVRCTSEVGVIERGYEFTDSTILDLGSDDLFYEAVYARPSSITLGTVFNKRNVGSAANPGYALSGTAANNINFGLRTNIDSIRNATATITANSWQYTAGFLDFSDTTSQGMRCYRGNDSSNTATHSGSTTNAINFRVGLQTNTASIAAQDITLVYIAVWKASDLGFPSGAANEALVTPMIRERQMLLAGTMPLKAPAATQYSDPYRISHRIRNGKKKGYRTGSGFTITDDFYMPDGSVQSGLYFYSSVSANAVGSEAMAGWTANNTTFTNNANVISPIDISLSVGPSSMIGTAGTSAKSISYPTTSPNTTPRIWQVFVKGGDKTVARIAMTSGTITNPVEAYVDLSTGQFVGTVTGEFGIRPYINDWYLVYFKYISVTTDNTTTDISFVDTAGSPNCTGDGSTINGYVYGAQVALANLPITNFPINITGEVSASPIMNFTGTSVAAPYSLYAEAFSETGVPSTPTAPIPVAIQTDGSNIVNLFTGGVGATMRIGSNGNNGSAPVPGAQWTLAAVVTAPDWINGPKVRTAVSAQTDNILLLGESGTLSTDTLGTPPSNLNFIRIGSNANNTAQGFSVQTATSAIFNKAITTVGEE